MLRKKHLPLRDGSAIFLLEGCETAHFTEVTMNRFMERYRKRRARRERIREAGVLLEQGRQIRFAMAALERARSKMAAIFAKFEAETRLRGGMPPA